MRRDMYGAAAALAILTLGGVHAQAQPGSNVQLNKAQGNGELYASAAENEYETNLQGATAGHPEEQHEFHRNHFGGFVGASSHSDSDDTGFTLGLEYARQFTPRWAVAAYTELVSGELERDIILAAGAIYYPLPRIGLVLGPGVEFVSKDVEQHGKVESETETELLLRIGASYAFPVGQASIGPVVLIDWASNRWTLVYGIGMVAGF